MNKWKSFDILLNLKLFYNLIRIVWIWWIFCFSVIKTEKSLENEQFFSAENYSLFDDFRLQNNDPFLKYDIIYDKTNHTHFMQNLRHPLLQSTFVATVVVDDDSTLSDGAYVNITFEEHVYDSNMQFFFQQANASLRYPFSRFIYIKSSMDILAKNKNSKDDMSPAHCGNGPWALEAQVKLVHTTKVLTDNERFLNFNESDYYDIRKRIRISPWVSFSYPMLDLNKHDTNDRKHITERETHEVIINQNNVLNVNLPEYFNLLMLNPKLKHQSSNINHLNGYLICLQKDEYVTFINDKFIRPPAFPSKEKIEKKILIEMLHVYNMQSRTTIERAYDILVGLSFITKGRSKHNDLSKLHYFNSHSVPVETIEKLRQVMIESKSCTFQASELNNWSLKCPPTVVPGSAPTSSEKYNIRSWLAKKLKCKRFIRNQLKKWENSVSQTNKALANSIPPIIILYKNSIHKD